MPYSDLIVKPIIVSVADDGTSIVVGDDTGTYPESPGGYAPTGEGTATRPALNQVLRWVIYRKAPFDDVDFVRIPAEQTGVPIELPTIGLDGESLIGAWQICLLVVSDSLSYAELLDEGYGFEQFVEAAQNGGAVGQVGLALNTFGANCFNDARRRYNNALFQGDCDSTEYETLLALWQGATSSIVVGQAYENPLDTTGAAFYESGDTILQSITTFCNTPGCKCNC
jgi:hypothetical protein